MSTGIRPTKSRLFNHHTRLTLATLIQLAINNIIDWSVFFNELINKVNRDEMLHIRSKPFVDLILRLSVSSSLGALG